MATIMITGPDGKSKLTINETAKLLGITGGAVRSRLKNDWKKDEFFTRKPSARHAKNGKGNNGHTKHIENRKAVGEPIREIYDTGTKYYSWADELRQRARKALTELRHGVP